MHFSLNFLSLSNMLSLLFFIVSFNFFISCVALSNLFIYIICCLFNSITSNSFPFNFSVNLLFSSKMNLTFITFSSSLPFNSFIFLFSKNKSFIFNWKLATTWLVIFSITLLRFLFSLNNVSILSSYSFLILSISGLFSSILSLFNSFSKSFFLSERIEKFLSFKAVISVQEETVKSLMLYFPLYIE